MASIAMMLGGALVNAFAFTGSSYLFRLLDGKSVDEERKRHDEAIEKLQKARDQWTQKRTARLDFISEDLRRQGHAVAAFRSVDDAMREYADVTGKQLSPLGPEPQLSQFYRPSDGQVSREGLFIALGLAGTGLVAYELARRERKARE